MMFDYLKTLYNSMKMGAYYSEVAKHTPNNHLVDEMTALMFLRS